MGPSHGRATSIAAIPVGIGFTADKIGVQTLSDHGPKTSPPSWIAEAVVAFPLALLFLAGAGFFSCPGEAGFWCSPYGAHYMGLLVVALQCPCCSPMPGQLLLGGRGWCQEY